MKVERARELLHTREVVCRGFRRSDGLFEFEGRLLDSKPHDTQLPFKRVAAQEPIHLLGMHLVLDASWTILEARAVSEAVPTPYCANVSTAYPALNGLKIGPGFLQQAHARVGGETGCTHLTHLLGSLAATVYQTLMTLEYEAEHQRMLESPSHRPGSEHQVIGTCRAYRRGGEAAERIIARSHSNSPELPERPR